MFLDFFNVLLHYWIKIKFKIVCKNVEYNKYEEIQHIYYFFNKY